MTSTLPTSSNVLGFIAASFSLLASGCALTVFRSHLPSQRIKVLESLLEETDSLFKEAIENGFLIQPEFVKEVQCRLTRLKEQTHCLQSRVYHATTLRGDYAEFFKGTSKEINHLRHSLQELRAEVITSSDAGRRKLWGTNQTANFVTSLPATPRPVRIRQPTRYENRATKVVSSKGVLLVILYDNNTNIDLESLSRIISSYLTSCSDSPSRNDLSHSIRASVCTI